MCNILKVVSITNGQKVSEVFTVGPNPIVTAFNQPDEQNRIGTVLDSYRETEYPIYKGQAAYLMNKYGNNVETIR